MVNGCSVYGLFASSSTRKRMMPSVYVRLTHSENAIHARSVKATLISPMVASAGVEKMIVPGVSRGQGWSASTTHPAGLRAAPSGWQSRGVRSSRGFWAMGGLAQGPSDGLLARLHPQVARQARSRIPTRRTDHLQGRDGRP